MQLELHGLLYVSLCLLRVPLPLGGVRRGLVRDKEGAPYSSSIA